MGRAGYHETKVKADMCPEWDLRISESGQKSDPKKN
jgi:hypothetical protein